MSISSGGNVLPDKYVDRKEHYFALLTAILGGKSAAQALKSQGLTSSRNGGAKNA